jgi:mono/diheme cytochrome c family protein
MRAFFRQLHRLSPAARIAVGLLAGLLNAAPPMAAPPRSLLDTGLYADGMPLRVAAGVLEFAPQYPLWSDGTAKRRWLWLPPGTAVDATRPDHWDFPVGTRAWKEFSFAGRVETRMIERLPDGSWRYAAYLWNAAGTEATLVSADGARLEAIPGAPGGRYAVPSQADCVACHEGAAVPLLGFSALQLSPDRDPLAPHATAAAPEATLPQLVARGWLRGLPAELLQHAPRIAASAAEERAALGYLHGNCGHCHNTQGPLASLGLRLARSAAAADPAPDLPGALLLRRLRSANPYTRMPPVGIQVSDHSAIALIERSLVRADINPEETRP